MRLSRSPLAKTMLLTPHGSPDGESIAFGEVPTPKAVIHLLNMTTRKVSVVPHSVGLYAPHWSPDGTYISALSVDSARLLLFNLQSQTWTELPKAKFGYPTWSRDSEYISFDTYGPDPAFFRVRIRDRKVERIASLKNVPRTAGTLAPGLALRPTVHLSFSAMPASMRSMRSIGKRRKSSSRLDQLLHIYGI